MYIEKERCINIKISDALLYAVYKNNNRMDSTDLLKYMKQLKQYDMLRVNKDLISFSLTDKAIERLEKINLI